MGRLAEEPAGLQVEDPLMGRRAIGTNQRGLGGPAMADGQSVKRPVVARRRSLENERHVHHDVDEQALRRHERAQVLALRLYRRASVLPAVIKVLPECSWPVFRYQGR